MNYNLNPNFPIIYPNYHQTSNVDWLYQPYYCIPHQFYTNFQIQHLKADEFSNGLSSVKRQECEEILPLPTVLLEEVSEKHDQKKKQEMLNVEDVNYLNKCQKSDRNHNSIVIRNFANFINNHPYLLKIVQKIIQKRNLNISAQHYKELFKNKFLPRQSYVGVGKLKNFIEIGKQHREVRIITLVLLRKFINTDFFTVLLNSKKVSKQAKQKELRHGKKFWRDFLFQYY